MDRYVIKANVIKHKTTKKKANGLFFSMKCSFITFLHHTENYITT